MADGIVVDGLAEFVASLKEAPARIRKAERAALGSGARKIVARAAVHAPRRSGKMAQDTAIAVTGRGVTITWRQPYAGVQEFATDYTRGGPRGGPVHMSGPPTPRFAYRARDELAASIAEEFLDEVARAAAGDWFEVR